MTVTKLTEMSASRVQVILDEEFAFVLYKGELRLFQLEEGKEIPEKIYRDIMENLLPTRAKKRALNLLKTRAYTEKQLRDKLKSDSYPDEITEKAIAYVTSFHYLDDKRYADDYIEYNKEKKSRLRIFNSLLQKGISGEVIEKAWEENVGEDEKQLEQEQILCWMKKKNFNLSEATYEEKQRFSAFLYRKGFKIEAIRCALLLDTTTI